MRPRLAFIALVLIYTALASLYAVNTPLWQVPDEPAHYNYIRTVAEQAALPVLQMGDYDQAYLEKIKAEKFRPDLPIDPIRYESHQPPLYYLLAAPVYKAGQTASLAARVMGLRLFSVLWGVVLLALIYQIARAVFDADEVVPLLAVALAAFVPQHLAMEASVNNDPLAEVALAGVALGLVKILKGAGARRWWWMVGALTGLGFLTKTTTYVSVGLIAVTLLMLARSEGYSRKPKELLSLIALPLGLAFFLGMLWFARNALIYGPTDWLALSRHRAVVAGQPT
ncbi:MAG: glycosyltransferase family 39 protein, partial [Chloroflexi bacterium]|nr:glycosyltransferase family 39 protein [Chloroflexota bacterium]